MIELAVNVERRLIFAKLQYDILCGLMGDMSTVNLSKFKEYVNMNNLVFYSDVRKPVDSEAQIKGVL